MLTKKEWETISDLQDQGLSSEEIYNVWMDRIATQMRLKGGPSYSDPDVTLAEKWAVYTIYPVPHKVIGTLSTSVNEALGYHEMLSFLLVTSVKSEVTTLSL
jgi:hypothetical protein